MANKKTRSNKKKGGGGGCGCTASTSIPMNNFFSGGKLKGGNILGPASLTNFDPANNYTIPLNMHKMDPLSPSELTDSRGLPNSAFTGGKKKSLKKKIQKKKKKSLKKRRINKKRGGAVDTVLQTYDANSLSNFATNTNQGAITGAHIVAGQPLDALSYQSINVSKPFL